jgi:hypothetical protein
MVNGLSALFLTRSARRRSVAVVGGLAAGLGLFGAIALGLSSSPHSQTLSALTSAADQSEAVVAAPMTFADRFAADVRDLPPTIGVAAVVADSPLALALTDYGARLGGEGAESVRAPRPPAETTGSGP